MNASGKGWQESRMREIRKSGLMRGAGPRIHGGDIVAPAGNQPENRENKRRPTDTDLPLLYYFNPNEIDGGC
ncbi:hypothetical protein [Salinibacter ruber]|uniref:hypothetical protein n=1 Tax=Salinibacter ruber TaxID=146919 RepID=UPI00216A24D3|nr:hypothetical protein [Salinibacter ruber]